MTTADKLVRYEVNLASPQEIDGRIHVAKAKYSPPVERFAVYQHARFNYWRFDNPRPAVEIFAEYYVFVNTATMPVVAHPAKLQDFIDPLQAEGGVDLEDERVTAIADSIKNFHFEEKVEAIIEQVANKIKFRPYQLNDRNDWVGRGSREVLDAGYGHDGQLCVTFIAICRVAGVPSVFVHGMVADIHSKKKTIENRSWVEIKRPDDQWMIVDVPLAVVSRQNKSRYNTFLTYIPYYWSAQTPFTYGYVDGSPEFTGGEGHALRMSTIIY